MYFEDFTQEEKDFFEEKLGSIFGGYKNDEIIVEDQENGETFSIFKYPCHKGTLYLLETEDDPDGIFEVNEGEWMQYPQYVYYEITKEGLEEYANNREEGYSLREYTLSYLGK